MKKLIKIGIVAFLVIVLWACKSDSSEPIMSLGGTFDTTLRDDIRSYLNVLAEQWKLDFSEKDPVTMSQLNEGIPAFMVFFKKVVSWPCLWATLEKK